MAPDALKSILDVYCGGDMEAAPAMAGQSAGQIHEVKSAKQIINDTVAEFFAISKRMGAMSAALSFG
jgi:enoyl-[acyl-carrier protein] reductase II